jgi:hypothetical protein
MPSLINPNSTARFSPQELQALQYVQRERQNTIARTFRGKEVSFKGSHLKEKVRGTAQELAGKAQGALGSLESLVNSKGNQPHGRPAGDLVRQKFEELVKSLFSVSTLDELGTLSGLVLDVLQLASVNVAPVIGCVYNGYEMFVSWVQVGVDLHKRAGLADCTYAIDTGAPAAAFMALKKVLDDETRNLAVAASQATASFGLKTGLTFVDGGTISGPVLGVVDTLATLVRELYLLATEWRATKAINQALAANQLDIRLFRTYPLMGCYLIISATLSDLIPIDLLGTPGWMDHVEKLKKNGFDEIYRAAINLVDASPWEISGLPKRKSSAALF